LEVALIFFNPNEALVAGPLAYPVPPRLRLKHVLLGWLLVFASQRVLQQAFEGLDHLVRFEAHVEQSLAIQVDHAVGGGGLLPKMKCGLRPKALEATVHEVQVAQVPSRRRLVEVDLLPNISSAVFKRSSIELPYRAKPLSRITLDLSYFVASPHKTMAPSLDKPPENKAHKEN